MAEWERVRRELDVGIFFNVESEGSVSHLCVMDGRETTPRGGRDEVLIMLRLSILVMGWTFTYSLLIRQQTTEKAFSDAA